MFYIRNSKSKQGFIQQDKSLVKVIPRKTSLGVVQLLFLLYIDYLITLSGPGHYVFGLFPHTLETIQKSAKMTIKFSENVCNNITHLIPRHCVFPLGISVIPGHFGNSMYRFMLIINREAETTTVTYVKPGLGPCNGNDDLPWLYTQPFKIQGPANVCIVLGK